MNSDFRQSARQRPGSDPRHRGACRRRCGLWCALLLFLGFTLPAPGRAAPADPDDAVKAAFLFRFTGYVDWPPEAFPDPHFTVVTLGAGGVNAELQRLLPRHGARGLPVRVRNADTNADLALDLSQAQMLYVGPYYTGDLGALIQILGTRPVLVVTDDVRGLDVGGTVNFVKTEHRVRFEISMQAAARAGLRVQPVLLSVAARVRGIPRSDTGCNHLPPLLRHPERCDPPVAGA